jgi:membrane-associated phospholipid phosphatase
MKRLGIIQSLSMEDKKDRLYPFLITGVFYLTTWFVFHNLQILELIAYIFVVASILVFLALFINLFWKISIHAMSMGALSVFILWLTAVNLIVSPWPAYLIIILSGLVGYARLKLKSHNSTQIYVGYLTGVIVLASFLLGLG